MHVLPRRARWCLAAIAAAATASCAMILGPLTTANAAPVTTTADVNASLPSCPFWASGITPPARSTTPWTAPLQTAPAVNFSTRPAAPTLSGTLVNGSITITVSPVPNAVAYKVWRDGVDIGYISYWGQTGPLTVTDTSPCQGAYYDVVAMYDTSNSDASLGQLSQPYWIGADGTLAEGPGDVAPGTQISIMVTSYDNTGSTASGYNAQLGVCATDPRVIPWGTYFTIPGYGTCYAGDLGTWIQNDTVDVWLPAGQASNWGVQDRTLTVIANPYASTATASSSPSAAPTTASASPSPTASTTPTSTPTATSSASSGACTAAPWNSSTAYNGGAIVSYNGHDWTAKWWTQGDIPGNNAQNVWTDDGAC